MLFMAFPKQGNGDEISSDTGAILDGFHGDAARTYPVGSVSPEALRLISVTEEASTEEWLKPWKEIV